LDRGLETAEPLVTAADRPEGIRLVPEVPQRGPRGPLSLVERQGGREVALLEEAVGLGGLAARLRLGPPAIQGGDVPRGLAEQRPPRPSLEHPTDTQRNRDDPSHGRGEPCCPRAGPVPF